MTVKRILALVAATGLIGLSPVYAVEDADELSLSAEEFKPYTEQVAAIDEESFESSQMAAIDESSDEGVAGRAGFEGEEGLMGSGIEGSDHWAVQTPSGGGLIDD